jgi:hypothetical protein
MPTLRGGNRFWNPLADFNAARRLLSNPTRYRGVRNPDGNERIFIGADDDRFTQLSDNEVWDYADAELGDNYIESRGLLSRSAVAAANALGTSGGAMLARNVLPWTAAGGAGLVALSMLGGDDEPPQQRAERMMSATALPPVQGTNMIPNAAMTVPYNLQQVDPKQLEYEVNRQLRNQALGEFYAQQLINSGLVADPRLDVES